MSTKAGPRIEEAHANDVIEDQWSRLQPTVVAAVQSPDAGTLRADSQGFASYVTPGWHTARMSKRFQVLSLDGGGYRGVFSAAVLAQLEEDLDLSISDHFDLIAGTSTGGVIALGLGAGLTPLEMVEFYTEQGPKIFGGHRRRWAKHLLRGSTPRDRCARP